ncbi:hypothetical protein D3C73_1662040 [compost metagenome]
MIPSLVIRLVSKPFNELVLESANDLSDSGKVVNKSFIPATASFILSACVPT